MMSNIRLKKERFLIVLFILAVLFISVSLAYSYQDARQNVVLESQELYHTVVVQKGDTLWSIAGENRRKGEDIRSLIHEIRKTNRLAEPVLYPGQQLFVPK